MNTSFGTQLTKHEVSCVSSLKRLAKRWHKEKNRLWLFSASGCLHVMMTEDETNPVSETIVDAGYASGGINDQNCVCLIDIPNDGGDW